MKKIIPLILAVFMGPVLVNAEEVNLQETCKAECPAAKNEHEAHECMKGVAQAKKNDKKFRKSDCYAALRDHEKHEKEEGHKH